MPNPFDQFDQLASSGPVTVGTPRPKKPEIRQVGNQLGVVDDSGHFTPTYTAPSDASTKPPTGEQGMAAGFYGRALYANQKYGSGVPPRDALTQGVIDFLPDNVANSLSGHDRQLANSYAKDFVAATLRKESGAAISPEEYANQYARYFPMPGDGPDTIAAKARLRDTAIAALKNQAGPAAPSAEKSVADMIAADNAGQQTEQGFGVKPDDSKQELTPDQQLRDRAFLRSNPSPEAYAAFLAGLTGQPIDAAKAAERLKAAQAGGTYNADIEDPRVQQKVDEMMRTGGGGGSAAVAGFGDTASLGFLDEAGAAANALTDSLSGNGSFGDNYNVNLQANRSYQQALQRANPIPYLGGQIAGGFALPAGEISGAGDLAKLAAGYGGAYGIGSGEGVSGRALGGVEGAAAGAATGYGLGKLSGLLRRNPASVPELVDPATGRLNEPLEAMTPGQRVRAASDQGINLPLGAATDRGGAIIEKGLDNLPGSAGIMNDARRVTEGQVEGALENVAGQFGSSRTLNEAGSELQRGANEYRDRASAVIGKAYNAIPIADTTPAANTSTVATLQQITGRFQSNSDLAAALHDPKLQTYLDAIQKGGLSWRDLKDFRSIIGEKIGEMRLGESSSTSDLRALYAGLSEDMRATASAQGPGALRAFERANNLNREHERMVEGALLRILGKDNNLPPEKAALAVQAMTKGGKSTGDLKTLAQIRGATIKSGAWDEIAGTLIRLGGQPANSEGRAFDPKTFVTWYSDMSEQARSMLFKPELRKGLDQFVAVNQRLAGSNALRNTSQTIPNFIGTGFAGAAGTAAMLGHVGTLMGIGAEMAGNFAMAKLWTSPAFVRWATGYARAATPNAARAQIGRLGKLAATNPELREPLIAIQQKLLSAVNDNVTPGLAADQGNQNNQ